jgi:pantoate--beta-alanine ligase
MQVIESIHQMQSHAIGLRSEGKLIGLVSTMGALHDGVVPLVEQAKDKADVVVVSIFVNPIEFGSNEDYGSFPRDREGDLQRCRDLGVDIVFIPRREEVYPEQYSTFAEEILVSKDLCGISRPQHFRGVATWHAKLFNIVRPDCAVFSRVAAQTSAVVRKMVEDLHIPVEILDGPVVRAADGTALSARLAYLTPAQREDAGLIYQALQEGKLLYEQGNRVVDRIVAEATHILSKSRRLRVIYVKVVDKVTMQPVREPEPGTALLMVSVWVEQTRLLDNIEL